MKLFLGGKKENETEEVKIRTYRSFGDEIRWDEL